VAEALALGAPGFPVDLRIFAKPRTLKNRRMGVALARGSSVKDALERAKTAASRVRIDTQG
jgi:phosphoribosylglycinamide formyltransferase 2